MTVTLELDDAEADALHALLDPNGGMADATLLDFVHQKLVVAIKRATIARSTLDVIS